MSTWLGVDVAHGPSRLAGWPLDEVVWAGRRRSQSASHNWSRWRQIAALQQRMPGSTELLLAGAELCILPTHQCTTDPIAGGDKAVAQSGQRNSGPVNAAVLAAKKHLGTRAEHVHIHDQWYLTAWPSRP